MSVYAYKHIVFYIKIIIVRNMHTCAFLRIFNNFNFTMREEVIGRSLARNDAKRRKFTSHIYREVTFALISGCIRGDVAHVVHAGIHYVSGSLYEIYDN